MTDPTFIPEADRELLVVYPDEQQAHQARDALVRAGLPEAEVHIAEPGDIKSALRAEMADELAHAFVVPNAAVAYTKESAMGLALLSALGTVIGLALAFPLAAIDLGSSYWTRWIVWAIVGVGFGLTIALVAGPSLGTRRPNEPNAAERGVVLRVEHDTPELRRLLADLHPIRLDEIAHDGMPIANVSHEGPATMGEQLVETAEQVVKNADTDDYNPADSPADTRR